MKTETVNLIDVRTPEEFGAGSVPNAVNVPLNEIVARLEELKQLQPMLIFVRQVFVPKKQSITLGKMALQKLKMEEVGWK